MKPYLRPAATIAGSIYICAILLSSLPYKFGNAPETQVIFGKLNAWGASLGVEGLFDQWGLFSQQTIGGAEFIASALLLLAFIPALHRLRIIGAALALTIMTGAISFHTLTPLGIDPNNDGGGLFIAACGVWVVAAVLLYLYRATGCAMLRDLRELILGK